MYQQKCIMTVYNKFPKALSGEHHRIHASVALMLHEWTSSRAEKRPADFSKITVQVINKACANSSTKYPLWPAFLHSTDLSTFASQLAPEHQWWIGDRRSDDVAVEDSTHAISFYYLSIIITLYFDRYRSQICATQGVIPTPCQREGSRSPHPRSSETHPQACCSGRGDA